MPSLDYLEQSIETCIYTNLLHVCLLNSFANVKSFIRFVEFFLPLLQNVKCDALRDLLPFVQLKTKRSEKHTWRSDTFSKILRKVSLVSGCFLRFLSCTNGTISRKASHITNKIIRLNLFQLQYVKVPMPPHRLKSSDWFIL